MNDRLLGQGAIAFSRCFHNHLQHDWELGSVPLISLSSWQNWGGRATSFPSHCTSRLGSSHEEVVRLWAKVNARFNAIDKALDVAFEASNRQTNLAQMKAAAEF